MTEEQLQKHQKWLRLKYGIDGEDIFQRACEMAIRKYKKIEKVNQSLFGLICRWAAREIRKHEKYEIPFSCLQTENKDREEFAEFEVGDPTWEKQYIAIEEREEVTKKYGQWLLNALLKAATEPNPSMVTTDCTYVYEKQMKLFEYV
jgi:DNA-directed RNA polymerase specialized sigma24 family protein